MRLCYFYRTQSDCDADSIRRIPRGGSVGVVIGDTVHKLDVPPDLLRDGFEWADGAFEKLAGVKPGPAVAPLESLWLGAPMIRPAQYLDFYAFEQHVKTARKLRGFDFVEPAWYEIPAYYNSNATTLYGHKQTVAFPAGEDRMDYECEMACVIGRTIRNATEATARDAIAGYTILNDLSARARQRKAMPIGMGPAPGKDFGSAIGPVLVTKEELPDLADLGMRAFVNGEQWTNGRFGTIHWSFEQMIVYASAARTLFPGDVLGSGTVGGGCGLELGKFLKPGDVVRLEIDGIGSLENRVERQS
jgi:2-keto-4-pentenoate hydratase/2-oxohepta-3-ene-1,7-dioic acid hydratase in catechol pathway